MAVPVDAAILVVVPIYVASFSVAVGRWATTLQTRGRITRVVFILFALVSSNWLKNEMLFPIIFNTMERSNT